MKKPGCTEPRLGLQATRRLGASLSPRLAAHVAACLACRLERYEFDTLAVHARPPSAELRAGLR